MNARRNIRASLHECVRLSGTDRWGKPFDLQGKSVDFSRKGLGLIVDRDLVSPGAIVSLDVPDKLHSRAIVQWTRPASQDGSCRVGLQLLNPKTSVRFRMAACFLLAFALFSQICISRPRGFTRATAGTRCTMGLADMKMIIQNALGKYGYLTEDEKTFLDIQHQRMSTAEYSKWLQGFFMEDRKRNAAMTWYKNTYQAQDDAILSAAARDAEAVFGGIE